MQANCELLASYVWCLFQGHHGDLLPEENRILLAEFYLRHRESTSTILHEYAKRKTENFMARLEHPEADLCIGAGDQPE